MSDSIKVKFNPQSNFNVKVNKLGGKLLSTTPITVKNQIQEIRAIDDIPGVNNALKTDGATLIYNSTTDEYDIKSVFDPELIYVETLYVETINANNSVGASGQVLHSNGSTVYWANTFIAVIDGGAY